jgi:hypothetical protein
MPDVEVHSAATERSQHRYLFHPKHHGAGSPTDSRWADDVTTEEEFSVFDGADQHEIACGGGWLYGILRAGDVLRILGTWSQQLAAFPFARPGEPWHGYPIWAIEGGPPNRSQQKMRPERAVFQLLVEKGLITEQERRRLWAGQHT